MGIITLATMELLRVSCLFALVLLASGLEFPSQDSESVSLDVQQITHEPLVNGQSMPRREWTSARPGARPMSPPPRVRSYQQRLGESTCQPCEEMGRQFGIVHSEAGKPPSWGKAPSHAKGCWIAMDCNLSMQQTSSLGESTAAAPPGLAGFNGEAPMATNQAPQEGGYLENGQMSASDAMFKPVEAELLKVLGFIIGHRRWGICTIKWLETGNF